MQTQDEAHREQPERRSEPARPAGGYRDRLVPPPPAEGRGARRRRCRRWTRRLASGTWRDRPRRRNGTCRRSCGGRGTWSSRRSRRQAGRIGELARRAADNESVSGLRLVRSWHGRWARLGGEIGNRWREARRCARGGKVSLGPDGRSCRAGSSRRRGRQAQPEGPGRPSRSEAGSIRWCLPGVRWKRGHPERGRPGRPRARWLPAPPAVLAGAGRRDQPCGGRGRLGHPRWTTSGSSRRSQARCTGRALLCS